IRETVIVEVESGPRGRSNYEIWLADGNEGTMEDFLAAQKGEKGDKGDAGDTTEAEALAQQAASDAAAAREDVDSAQVLIATGAQQVAAAELAALQAQQAQLAGYVGFATLDDLNANLDFEAGA